MQHTGRLTGLSSQLGQRARTNSEQLLAVTRTHGEWERDPEKIRLTPGSVSITSGVWPDPVTSIEPVYWGVGSDLFAYLVNEHRDGAQKHPTASWVKELAEHPGQVLAFDDARHWSERTVIMLCSQTTDTSIELYWDDGRLRAGTALARRPRCTSRSSRSSSAGWPRRWEPRRRAAIRDHQPRRLGSLRRRDPDRRQQRQRRRRSLPARVRPARAARHGRKRHAGQPRSEPVTDDHGSGRTGDVAVAEQGRRRTPGRRWAPATSASTRSCRTGPSYPQAHRASCDSTPGSRTSSPNTRTEPARRQGEDHA